MICRATRKFNAPNLNAIPNLGYDFLDQISPSIDPKVTQIVFFTVPPNSPILNSFILREHNIRSRLRNPIEKRALNSRILATLLDLSSRTLLAVLPSLSLSPSFQPMTKFSLSVGGRGRPCIIRRQSRSVGGARRGNAIDSIFNIKGAVTEGKLKQRVDRAQNGRGTFILSRRHWQEDKARRPSNHLCVAAALPPILPLSHPFSLSLSLLLSFPFARLHPSI